MLKMTSCVGRLVIYEIKVWGVELLNCYNSDDQCGRFNNVDSLSYNPANIYVNNGTERQTKFYKADFFTNTLDMIP